MTANLIIDSSVALAALLPDEQAHAALKIMQRVASAGTIVPSVWRLEVGNVLLMSLRRGRLSAHQKEAIQRGLDALPVHVDAETDAHALAGTFALAERTGLTLYDAAYLELAIRANAELATLDGELARAAQAVGVALAI